ncbi:MAG: glycosyl transferase [Chloroflexi bacterium RBG_19FT_COMBO_56_12]|nr:MAG: glycosyl transferase [Chloroflexi bacterium RBG_19FT_COMBO_56_12]
MSKIVVVIPTYNEVDNLLEITSALFALDVQDLELLIVDDNSPDGTGQMADSLAAQYPGRFHVLHRPGKLGLGTAYIEGFLWALDRSADLVIQMDADFSHSPAYIPRMLELITEVDVVVGSRYVPGGRLDERWSWGRWFLSWWANSVWVRLILGTHTRDATAGFKCWRASALRQLGLENICSNGYVFQVEMCYVAEKAGLRIREIPIYFEDRRIGQSKMSVPVKLEAAVKVFEIRRRYRRVR